jgi:hypothetical protein
MAKAAKLQEVRPLDELQIALITTIEEANKKWRGVGVINKGEQKKLASVLKEIAAGVDPSNCGYTGCTIPPVLVLTKWIITQVVSVKYVVDQKWRIGGKPYWRCGLECVALNTGFEALRGCVTITHASKGLIVDPQQPSVEELLCHPSEVVRTIGKEMSETLPV